MKCKTTRRVILQWSRLFIIQPYYVICVSQKELLGFILLVVYHTNSCNKIHHVLGIRVIQVIPALVPAVAIHPFQAKLVLRSSLVRHYGAPTFASRPQRAPAILPAINFTSDRFLFRALYKSSLLSCTLFWYYHLLIFAWRVRERRNLPSHYNLRTAKHRRLCISRWTEAASVQTLTIQKRSSLTIPSSTRRLSL